MELSTDFYVEPASWQHDEAELRPVRIEVFVGEQRVPADEEFDHDDPISQHFVARDGAGSAIGTARLTPDGRIGRMAVVRAWRGRGVGRALLRAAVEAAGLQGVRELRLSSQVHAIPFYEQAGFVAEGPEYDEVGIPHRWMRRTLEPPDLGPVERRERAPLAVDELEGRFEGPTAYRDAVVAVLRATRRYVAVFSQDLEPAVLDDALVVAALGDLLAEARGPEVRVVVRDSGRAIDIGHRWIGLAHRRSSALAFRRPPPAFEEEGSFLVSDRRHVIRRELASEWSGYLRVDDPQRARQLLDHFDTAWEHGTPDPDLQRLDL